MGRERLRGGRALRSRVNDLVFALIYAITRTVRLVAL